MSSNWLIPRQDAHRDEPAPGPLPSPPGPAYIDRVTYHAVHFYGRQLNIAMRAAADYLDLLEQRWGFAPHVACSHDEFSAQDACGELAWKVSMLINVDSGVPPR